MGCTRINAFDIVIHHVVTVECQHKVSLVVWCKMPV